MSKFDLVKSYLHDMGLLIVSEDPDEELVVIEKEDIGLKNLIIDCEPPILVLEQPIMRVPAQPDDLFQKLLIWNRQLVHGAFVLDESGQTIIFRDTLELENLDRNEIEASIQALSLALAEFSADLLKYNR